MTPEEERRLFAEMFGHLDRIDPWLGRMDPAGTHEPPAERSVMSRDDKETDPFQISHAAWHALSHAVDHLHCLRALLKDAHLMHMYAPYSLVRAALENASAAVWLLHPDDCDERILRRLRFAALDIRNGEEARRLVDAPAGPKTEADRIEQIRALAQRRRVDQQAVLKKRPVSYGEIVKVAASTRRPGETAYVIIWKMCSGIAHGDLWTTLGVMSREELPGAPPDIAHLKITASVKTLMLCAYYAVDMTDVGWGLYDERSRRSAPKRPRPKRP